MITEAQLLETVLLTLMQDVPGLAESVPPFTATKTTFVLSDTFSSAVAESEIRAENKRTTDLTNIPILIIIYYASYS
ncbi:hypothetical protein [Vibrio penaeicida]|uniref:Uncharacterized protein n=1 Tax=Vibrio penaeicida TaxID=104609 RepID=A0AAV5NRJ2_9VIBR|nr:hypothetical protein [Vibrio penaeicida]GLQ72944.1 hypothetical protein GCM10007932_23040 [Vibrio penaeicida]